MSETWEDAVRWLREQPEQQELVLAAYYDDPLIEAAQRFWASEEWQATRELLRGRNGRALEIGAGRGIASYALARDGWDVTALEPDPSDLVGAGAIRALSQESGYPITVEQRLSEQLPFKDNSFDLIYGRAVLHHIGDLEAACREFARVLKPGGLLLAMREHVISKPEDLPAFFDNHPLHHRYGGENAFPAAHYQSAITGAGLRLRRTFGSLETPINIAPFTRRELAREIAARMMPLPFARPPIAALLYAPVIGTIAMRAIQATDRRPGRLTSFVAER